MNNEEAGVDCNLHILEELCDFDLIKEANLELHTRGRKVRNKKINSKIFFLF